MDDVDTSNPIGRVSTDFGGSRREQHFLKCKKNVNIATMNSRTLRKPHKQVELCAMAKKYNINAIGIQEHRIVHSDNSQLEYENLADGYQMVTISAWRNSVGAAIGGVGVLLSTFARKALLSVSYVTARILKVTRNPQTTIIVTYCPTNVTDEEEVI